MLTVNSAITACTICLIMMLPLHAVALWISTPACRCWPQHTNPSEHPLWHLAQRLGASCSMSFEAGVTTHVVVAPDKNDVGGVPLTDKVRHNLSVLNITGAVYHPLVETAWVCYGFRQRVAND
jgi:hypothetical protein